MKQLAFLIISSTPSLKNIAQISNHSWPNQLIFTIFLNRFEQKPSKSVSSKMYLAFKLD